MNSSPAAPIAFSIEKAHQAQQRMSKLLILTDQLPQKIRHIAGVDVAYTNNVSVAATAVLNCDTLELEESQTASCKTLFPYIPTLLSFREIMPTVMCIRKLKLQPDVVLANGHGYAHPYNCGLASHLGLILRKPTIGVAKSKLIGNLKKTRKGTARLTYKGKTIGTAITIKPGNKQIYVSIGHMISLKTAVEIVKNTTQDTSLPKPLLEAHKIATKTKRKINIQSPTQNKQW